MFCYRDPDNPGPEPGANAYHNRAEVAISNHPEAEHIFIYRESFDLPEAPTSELTTPHA